MRIITRARLREFWQESRTDEPSLKYWDEITSKAKWDNPNDVRKTFGNVDSYKSKNRLVYIFNVGGNRVRLICDINFKTQIVYILFVLSHDDYSKDRWKKSL